MELVCGMIGLIEIQGHGKEKNSSAQKNLTCFEKMA